MRKESTPGPPAAASARRAKTTKRPGRAKTVLARPAPAQGWDTTDEHELELRRWRGRTEIAAVEALEPDQPVFGAFRARSENGRGYVVEIRTLEGFDNSCGCIDHRVNGLGTCKHIEGVLAGLRRRGVRALRQAGIAGSARVEVFVRRHGDPTPVLTWPRDAHPNDGEIRAWLAPYLSVGAELRTGLDDMAALVGAHADAPAYVKAHLRVSRHVDAWLDRHRRMRSRETERAAFLAQARSDPGAFDVVRLPLLPYQREGMMHLAFGERALLADEMGLGKTVQAIAACELLARRKGICRVLIVCPASLKAEWE
jgi:hypothetical protein